jgi:4-hydroxyphenylpyruvate dioxygenase
MNTAIATVCLSGALDEKLLAIANAGFKGVEIFENDLLSFNGSPRDIRRAVEDLGLKIVTFQPFRDFEGMPPERRERDFIRAERKFDLMAELGCDLLMVCSNVSPESIGGIDRAAEDFHSLGERAARRGMRIGFEALAWGRHINDYRDAWEVVRRADHPAVGLVLDTFHILARGTDLTPIAAVPRDRIFLVQLADAPRLEMDYLSWSRHFRNFPGQGDFPVLDFLVALHQTGYDGLLSLEIFNDQFRAGSARGVAIDGHRSLIHLLDRLAERTGTVRSLPPRASCLGTEFVEFAVDEAGAPRFNALLRGLGFSLTGRHRSKSVTRWSQGDINLVVNAETEGFAHSFWLTHGTAVCALCLRVDDAVETVRRARGLLDQPFHQPVGPGELEIPAVRGLGGSLLYFTDPASGLTGLWDVDFEPTGQTVSDIGLTRVDHIAQAMHYEEMLSWLLFYTSLLAVDKASAQDVTDPGGLVRSQVVQSADGTLRVVLNASQSSRTQSSRFLSELFGSGVQHIALATDDIIATVTKLRANGVPLLDIPANYYDDLDARTGLAGTAIERLKALNILYDRDGAAEYFQAYTHAFEDRFFFEIVQRRNYAGFGAANAPIRLAAQSRLAQTIE